MRETGAYKRHWGAYGNKPDDAAPRTRVFEGPGAPQFNLVHGIRISNDGLVYVGDRVNNRVQVFKLDGTFVKEGYIERKTSGSEGTAFDVAFSPDKQQRFFYVPDGTQQENPDHRSRRHWRSWDSSAGTEATARSISTTSIASRRIRRAISTWARSTPDVARCATRIRG